MAVTVTVTSTVITVTSTDSGVETLESLYQAAIALDATCMSKSGSDPYTYTVNIAGGQDYRQLRINAGCSIEMDNAGDTLELAYSASTYRTCFYILGEFRALAGGQTLDMHGNMGSSGRPFMYLSGLFEFRGTVSNRSTIKNWTVCYDYTEGNENAFGRVQGYFVQYVDYVDQWVNSLPPLYVGQYSVGVPVHEFKDLTFTQPTGGNMGYLAYISYQRPYQFVTYENIVCDGLGHGLYCTTGQQIKFKNVTMKNVYQEYPQLSQPPVIFRNPIDDDSYNYSAVNPNQPFGYYEDCSFLNNRTEVAAGSRYGIYAINYSYTCIFKNCTFGGLDAGNQIYRAWQVTTGAVIYLVGTTTFQHLVSSTEWYSSGGHVLKARELTITVKDLNGDPISEASVVIRQSEGRELYRLISDTNGDVCNGFGDPIVVTEGEYTGTTLAGTFVDWSDSIASGRYHTITASAPGYALWEQNYEVTEDKTINIVMIESSTVTGLEMPVQWNIQGVN